MPGIEVWTQFDHDPREPANATMRASDRDRAVIETVLADAFAEGRLTRGEYDERVDTAMSARHLGDLIPLVGDLPVSRPPQAPAPRSSIPDEAERAFVRARRQAAWGFLSASLICWVIWLAINFNGGYTNAVPWPLFVMLGTGLNLGRTVWQKDEIVEEETRRLEKRERKAIEKRQSLGE